MSLRTKALKGSAILTVSEGVIYGSSFLRNMILARLLTKADFGIAATFTMIIMLLEFSAKLGVARFVVRDKEGDQPVFLAAAHTVQFIASIVSVLLILAVSWPLAMAFGIGEHHGALLALATVPLLNGLAHLDTRRFEREMRFGPSAWVEMVPQLVITVLAWPLALWLKDYRVVLVLMIIKSVLSCAGSHWMAEQRYRWSLHREYTLRMLKFGWPLVLNGFLMFAVLRADQFIVASFYSMRDLGGYAAAASLTMAPTLFFTRVFASVMLPMMAKAQDDPREFNRRYGLIIAVICAFSAGYGASLIIGAEVAMRWVFGRQYEGSGMVLALLVAANTFRNIRLAPTISALAKGDSMNQVVSNVIAGVSLVPALMVAVAEQPLWMVAGSGLAGEVLACGASFVLLKRRDQVPLSRSMVPTGLVAVVVLVAGLIAAGLGTQAAHPVLVVLAAGLGGCVGGALLVAAMRESREEAHRLLERGLALGWRGLLPLITGGRAQKKAAVS